MRLSTADTGDTQPSPSGLPLSNYEINPSEISNGLAKVTNGSSRNGVDSNGGLFEEHTNGNIVPNTQQPQGPWFGHDREEVTRILVQALHNMGYQATAGMLSMESGYELEGPAVASFRNAILRGDWVKVEILLFGSESLNMHNGLREDGIYRNGKSHRRLSKQSVSSIDSGQRLTLAEGANKNEMLFWVRQQKYLELLEKRDLGNALMVLRHELTPLNQDTHRLHVLSRYMAADKSSVTYLC